MVKGLFVGHTLKKVEREKLLSTSANEIILDSSALNSELISWFQEKGVRVNTSVSVFPGLCPSDPLIQSQKLKRIKEVNGFSIDGIWLDSIRYPIYWEKATPEFSQAHWCRVCEELFQRSRSRNKKLWRCEQITGFIAKVRRIVPRKNLGVFSIPWRKTDFAGAIETVVGQSFRSIAKYVDVFSPMLYHRMIGKTPSYISYYVAYLEKETGRVVLPIIQIKDMPDYLQDKLDKKEIENAFFEAVKSPSGGVLFFSWEQALEKAKVKVIKNLFDRGP